MNKPVAKLTSRYICIIRIINIIIIIIINNIKWKHYLNEGSVI